MGKFWDKILTPEAQIDLKTSAWCIQDLVYNSKHKIYTIILDTWLFWSQRMKKILAGQIVCMVYDITYLLLHDFTVHDFLVFRVAEFPLDWESPCSDLIVEIGNESRDEHLDMLWFQIYL